MSEERALRARSFGSIAGHYDRFRPGPPREAVEWLVREPVGAAVDIGAGTGALTRLLAARADHVYAVEPDPRMAEVLAANVPAAEVRAGQAEALPLEDATVDVVLGASMWHWVDEERASAEVARVLRPGGVFGLLWSGPDRSQEWVSELLGQANPRRDPAEAARDSRRRRHEVHLPAGAPFAPPESHLLRWTRTVTLDELAGLAGTFSVVIRLPESEREGLHERLLAYVREHPPAALSLSAGEPVGELVGDGRFELPMRCYCWRTVRD